MAIALKLDKFKQIKSFIGFQV